MKRRRVGGEEDGHMCDSRNDERSEGLLSAARTIKPHNTLVATAVLRIVSPYVNDSNECTTQ